MNEENKIRDAADAIKGVVEAVPVYQDVAQPALQEVGKGLATVAKTVHIALAPLASLVWGYEKLKDFISDKVAEKLKNVPPEKIITPSPLIAGPALEALRYAGHEQDLSELYANLLAGSMDINTAQAAHPSFVEIIKQLSPDEAKLLKWLATQPAFPLLQVSQAKSEGSGSVLRLENFSLFGEKAQCQHPHFTPSYITNLERLGLINLPESFYTTDSVYDEVINHPTVIELKKQIETQGLFFKLEKRCMRITPLGRQFITACVQDKK